MFACRNSPDTRTTGYSVSDVNGLHSVNLQTTGTGAGSTNLPFGNDDTIVSLNGLVPDASGQLDLAVAVVNGDFAYLAVLQVVPVPVSSFLPPAQIAGGWQLQFNGTPGYAYHVQRAPEVVGPWTDLGVAVAPGNGVVTFIDTNAPATRSFYRTVVP